MAKSKYANWYADRRWRRRRAQQLAKEPLCRFCAQQGKVTPADVADHIKPHKGSVHEFYYGELQSLCHECHSSVKQRMELGLAPKGCGVDGWPIGEAGAGVEKTESDQSVSRAPPEFFASTIHKTT